MKNFLILLVILFFCLPGLAQNQVSILAENENNNNPASFAPITKVLLYSNIAEITREAKINRNSNNLYIPNIPLGFNQNSLRIEADDGIEIGDSTIIIKQKNSAFIEEEKRLEEEINKLRNLISGFDIEIESGHLQLDYLKNLKNTSDKTKSIEIDELLPLLTAMDKGSQRAQRKIHNANENKKVYQRKLAELNEDLKRIRPRINKVANINIRLNARKNGKVLIKYHIQNAGWRPAYRASLTSNENSLELERIAKIAQKSGEDWKNVQLTLSTGSPTQRVFGHTPYPWELDFIKPRPKVSKKMLREGAVMSAPATAQMFEQNEVDDELIADEPVFSIAVENTEFKTEYKISKSTNLLADGRSINVSLAKINLPIELYAQTSPRIEQSAYLIAKSDIPEGIWPIGEIQLYRDGAYIGKSQLNLRKAKEMELYFGLDELIKVKLKPQDKISDSKGLIISSNEKRFKDVFAVTNLHKKSFNVEVLDASPIARHKDIKITRKFKPDITKDNWKSRQGVVRWFSEIESNKTSEFSTEYIIKWPKDKDLSNLR